MNLLNDFMNSLKSKQYKFFFLIILFIQLVIMPAMAEKKIRVAVTALPPFLGHPFATTARPSSFTTTAIYDGLLRFDKKGAIVPFLATSWENIDKQTWRFKLRDGVSFSNGTPLTSQSLKATVDWLSSDDSLRDGVRGEIPFLKDVRIVDRLTADIYTTIPVPDLPRYAGALVMVEPELFTSLGRQGYAENPIGTGPFMLKKWSSTKIELSAFRSSWRAPKADALEIIAIPNVSGRVQALTSSRVDIAVALGPDDIMPIEASGGVMETWVDASVAAVSFVTVNGGPLKDVRVRQALNYAVNKQVIIDSFFGGITKPATQGVSHQAFGYNENLKPYDYNPDKAKKLLSDAGYADGFKFVFITPTGSGSGGLVFQQVASDLSRVGVKMEIKQMPAAAYLNAVLRDPDHANANAHSLIWPAWQTFDSIRPLLMHSCRRKPAWHCDSFIQPKIEEALIEWEPSRALQLRRELMTYTRETAPAIFLYENPEFTGLSNRVRGYYQFYGYIGYNEIDLVD